MLQVFWLSDVVVKLERFERRPEVSNSWAKTGKWSLNSVTRGSFNFQWTHRLIKLINSGRFIRMHLLKFHLLTSFKTASVQLWAAVDSKKLTDQRLMKRSRKCQTSRAAEECDQYVTWCCGVTQNTVQQCVNTADSAHSHSQSWTTLWPLTGNTTSYSSIQQEQQDDSQLCSIIILNHRRTDHRNQRRFLLSDFHSNKWRWANVALMDPTRHTVPKPEDMFYFDLIFILFWL